MTTLHEFSVKNIDGKEIKLSDYQGKVVLIVNVASQCGYTPQYKGLEALYQTYKDRGFEILGFPSNDFGAQEPGTETEIKQFCDLKYNVSFNMFSKVKVKGSGKVELYKYLTEATKAEVQWNFNKFLVDKSGNVVKYYASGVSPESPELRKEIESLLA